jgi:thioredoxin 1
MAREVTSGEDLATVLGGSGPDVLVVVDFYATWCPPCRAVAPDVERMAHAYGAGSLAVEDGGGGMGGEMMVPCVFVTVDVDRHPDVARSHGIWAMPTFKLFRGGALYHRMAGGDARRLEGAVRRCAGPDAEPDALSALTDRACPCVPCVLL